MSGMTSFAAMHSLATRNVSLTVTSGGAVIAAPAGAMNADDPAMIVPNAAAIAALLGGTQAYNVTAAGTDQATATALPGNVLNSINGVPAGSGVILPETAPGMLTVRNDSVAPNANVLTVYPPSGGTLNGSGSGTKTIPPGGYWNFIPSGSGVWSA